MVIKNNDTLFIGLSHIGQVFALSWYKKFKNCSVYDFNKKNILNFKNKKFTIEEPNLVKLKKYANKIEILNQEKDIIKFKNIFFTYDTPLNLINGNPNLKLISKYLKKLLKLKFRKKINLFITSQVYPGFTEEITKQYKKKINIIYMVDTLKMGVASEVFLSPEQLIFGTEKKNLNIIKKIFRNFNSKIYIYTIKEAEFIKMSLNLYLFFSVSYANILDYAARKIGINFSNLLPSLENDKRIGKFAYIKPSLGVSGGHLERDCFYFQKINNLKLSNTIIKKLINFNNFRKKMLKKIILKYKNKKILIVGYSYKDNSMSLVNSVFKDIIYNKKFNIQIFDDRFKIKNSIKKNNIKNFQIFIYNYSNKKNEILIKKIIKNKKKFLINISNKKKFKEINSLNLF
jgi:nucleotide sugar dehydrogenase